MIEKLRGIFPEFTLIENDDLRDKALRVYEDTLDRFGRAPEDLERMPFTLLIPDVDVDYVQHVRAVTLTCHRTASVLLEIYHGKIAIDMDFLLTGALLHDVGKLAEFAEEGGRWVKSASGRLLRHTFSGVALCARHDIPEEILHIIAVHSREGEGFRRTTEAIILHHADFANFEPLKK